MKKIYVVLLMSLFVLGWCGLTSTKENVNVQTDNASVNVEDWNVNVQTDGTQTASESKWPSFYVTWAWEVTSDSWTELGNTTSDSDSSADVDVSASWSVNVDSNWMQINSTSNEVNISNGWASVKASWETSVSASGVNIKTSSWSTNVNDIIDLNSIIWE